MIPIFGVNVHGFISKSSAQVIQTIITPQQAHLPAQAIYWSGIFLIRLSYPD